MGPLGTLLKSDLQVSNISANVSAKTNFPWALKKNVGDGKSSTLIVWISAYTEV